jgi:Ca2+:H+ antiporter
LNRWDWIILVAGALAAPVAGLTHFYGASAALAFLCATLAVAALAALVGRSVEQVGDRFGAGATGVLQGALGNLPELFIGIFALRAGLLQVVQAAIIGSILANALLLLGLAFVVGSLRHGVLRFDSARARMTCALLILVVGALVLPGIGTYVRSPVANHQRTISTVVSVVLLAVFLFSLPAALGRGREGAERSRAPARWPLPLAVIILSAASLGGAFVSDWFVSALGPTMATLHISDAVAGLVVVAIASNAIEHVVGIQLAARNQADHALSVIINSPLQVALVLAPALVLISYVIGGADLTLVFSPLLVAAVALALITVSFIIFDGESNWVEGIALIGLYIVTTSLFWWG